MAYYDDYIRETAESTFENNRAEFTVYDLNNDEVEYDLDPKLNKRLFDGAMCEMVAYIYERRNEGDWDDAQLLFDAENVANVYITTKGLSAPVVIVEYEETPENFRRENADLREFYWYPRPALSGEWTAGYFQFR